MNLKKKHFNKRLFYWKTTTKKNNKVKYQNVKQFKIQTMQTKHW
jgi:hypothetical protein